MVFNFTMDVLLIILTTGRWLNGFYAGADNEIKNELEFAAGRCCIFFNDFVVFR